MADRVVSPHRFHAEGAAVPWPWLARRQLASRARTVATHVDRTLEQVLGRLAEERPGEVHLRWACSAVLGAPPGPFTVWSHPGLRPAAEVEVRATSASGYQELRWDDRTASVLDVTATAIDGSRPVQLFGFRGTVSPTTLVAWEQVTVPAGSTASLLMRGGGFTRAALVNGSFVSGTVDRLLDVVRDDGWEELEVVGLPVAEGSVPGYDDREHGLVHALTTPEDAAVQRVVRGGPPIGWWPVTETGVAAPPWAPADPDALVDEVVRELLPVVAPIYRELPHQQAAVVHREPMDRPEQDGRQAGDPRDAELPPFGALLLSATTDPYLALATGFGTAYRLDEDLAEAWGEGIVREQVALLAAAPRSAGSRGKVGRDFLVTADYPDTPEGGPATYAAYVPWPGPHLATAPVTDLTAARDGLVEPLHRDAPWRETVRLRWRHVEATAALGRPSGIGACRAEPAGAPTAESLLTERDAGGWRTLVPVVEPPAPGHTNADHDRLVDVARDIPLDSGGRTAVYAVATHDVFGVWSPWEDVGHTGPEPAAGTPRVMNVRVTSRYEGTPVCPSDVEVELAVDWRQRTPSAIEVVAVAYPATAGDTPPPAAAAPTAAAPAGCHRQDVLVSFTGPVASSTDATVTHLDATGEVATAGSAQSDDARRYRLRWAGPPLDHGAHAWWGVVVWARVRWQVLAAPGGWAPVPPTPTTDGRAYAHTASPVPPALPVPPPLPGVPVGSTPDADGRSHVRVRWPAASGPVAAYHVWELTEGAVRSVLHAADGSVPLRPPAGEVPGARLEWLRTRLAAGVGGQPGLPAWRGRFRRVTELGPTAREADVALEPGSEDIHLFVVTAETTTGIRSPWPTDVDAVQAYAAPRVRVPAAPALRPSFGTAGDGSATLELEAEVASTVPVAEVHLFRTRSEVAARSAETMGPPFAVLPAAATGGETSAGETVYGAAWSGPVPTGWTPTRLRAVAVPVPAVPTEAVVGAPSPGSPQVVIDVPPGDAPTLLPLTADTFDGTGVVVRTATDAPVWPVPAGPFHLDVEVTSAAGDVAAPVTAVLAEVEEADVTTPPGSVTADPTAEPLLRRAPRNAGSSPLAVWFRRPAVGTAVHVTVRLVDPLGRTTTRAVDVPAGTVGTPPSLRIVDRFAIAGRGVVVTFESDAPVRPAAGRVARLRIRARTVPPTPRPTPVPIPPVVVEPPRPIPPGRPGLPGLPGVPGVPGRPGVPAPPPAQPRPIVDPSVLVPPGRFQIDPDLLVAAGRWQTLEADLPDVPLVDPALPRRRGGTIEVVRTSDRSPFAYQALVRLSGTVEVAVAVTGPDGLETERKVRVG